jgi:hypothetical protein
MSIVIAYVVLMMIASRRARVKRPSSCAPSQHARYLFADMASAEFDVVDCLSQVSKRVGASRGLLPGVSDWSVICKP